MLKKSNEIKGYIVNSPEGRTVLLKKSSILHKHNQTLFRGSLIVAFTVRALFKLLY